MPFMGLNGLWIFFFFVRTIYLGTEIFRPIKFSKNNINKNKTRLWGLTWWLKGLTVLGGGEYPGSAPEVCSPKYLCLNRSNARFDKTPDTDFFFSRRFAPRSSVISKRWTDTNFIEPVGKYFWRSKSTLGSLKECFQCILGGNRHWVPLTPKTLAFESLQSDNRSSHSDFT